MGELRGEVTAIGVFSPDPIERLASREGAVDRVIAVAHGQERPVAGDVAAEARWQGGFPGLLWRGAGCRRTFRHASHALVNASATWSSASSTLPVVATTAFRHGSQLFWKNSANSVFSWLTTF